jgi:quinol-cytochrome oxidoreductase complex cytochrome b subunit
MLSAIILIIHFCAVVCAFFYYKKTTLSDGVLAAALMGIVFAVGWTVATMLTNLIFAPEWFIHWYYRPLDSSFWVAVRKEFNQDTISLIILSAGEIVFYYFYLKLDTKKGPSSDEPSQTPEP